MKTVAKFLIGAGIALQTGLTAPLMADEAGQALVPPLDMADDAWAVMAGSSLKETLEGWSRESSWQIVWDNPVDYRLRASAVFYGSFEDAVGRLVDAIHQNNSALSVTLYRGNNIMHVEGLPLTSN